MVHFSACLTNINTSPVSSPLLICCLIFVVWIQHVANSYILLSFPTKLAMISNVWCLEICAGTLFLMLLKFGAVSFFPPAPCGNQLLWRWEVNPFWSQFFYYVAFCLCTLHMQCLQVSQWVYLFCNELHSAFSYNVVIYSNLAAHWGISSPMGLYAYSGATMFMQWSENQQCLNSCPAKRKDKHFHTFQKEREMGQHSTTRRHLTICAIVFYRTWCHCNFTVQQNTLSVRLRSQRPVSRNRRTMCVCPCSQAPISAVEPSRSWAFTSEPQLRSSFTMATRPWLTASMSAVWPAWRNSEE